MRGATVPARVLVGVRLGFNPRPSCEGRRAFVLRMACAVQFQSTPLMRGATVLSGQLRRVSQVVSIHAPHARGDHMWVTARWRESVSIHAPHARGDRLVMDPMGVFLVSIHAPHARGDTCTSTRATSTSGFQSTPLMRGATSRSSLARSFSSFLFQSTPLMRGATRGGRGSVSTGRCFNPRPSCEGRHREGCRRRPRIRVSIHAPHARGDVSRAARALVDEVSIHAPHARGDHRRRRYRLGRLRFNPRPSCEGRLRPRHQPLPYSRFQSTPLMRGATSLPI